MAKIGLTKGKFALVDEADVANLSKHKWQLGPRGYATRSVWDGQHKNTVWMHREILSPPEELEVDHINRDRLDNRRANLRLATRAQNEAAKPLSIRNTSGYRGVNWCQRTRRWRASIKAAGRSTTLGYFHSKTDAAMAWNEAAKDKHGQFAQLNVLPEFRYL